MSDAKPCPQCGYCPTCGRANQPWQQPPWQPLTPLPGYPPIWWISSDNQISMVSDTEFPILGASRVAMSAGDLEKQGG